MSTRKHNKKCTKKGKTKKNKLQILREMLPPKKWRSFTVYMLYNRIFT